MPRFLEHDWFSQPLPDNVVVGERSWIYSSFAFLHYRSTRRVGVSIGSDSGVYNGCFFDLGPHGEVHIGDYCSIVGAIFSCDGRVVIDDYAFIAHEVVVAETYAAHPKKDMLSERNHTAKGGLVVSVGRNAWIGARAVLLNGARIGEGAIVGACAVVDFDVPPSAIVAGNPARIMGKVEP